MQTGKQIQQFVPLRCKTLPNMPRESSGSAGIAQQSPQPGGCTLGRAGGTSLVPDVPSLQDVLVTIYFALGHITLTVLVTQQVRFKKRKLYELYQDPRVKAMSTWNTSNLSPLFFHATDSTPGLCKVGHHHKWLESFWMNQGATCFPSDKIVY